MKIRLDKEYEIIANIRNVDKIKKSIHYDDLLNDRSSLNDIITILSILIVKPIERERLIELVDEYINMTDLMNIINQVLNNHHKKIIRR